MQLTHKIPRCIRTAKEKWQASRPNHAKKIDGMTPPTKTKPFANLIKQSSHNPQSPQLQNSPRVPPCRICCRCSPRRQQQQNLDKAASNDMDVNVRLRLPILLENQISCRTGPVKPSRSDFQATPFGFLHGARSVVFAFCHEAQTCSGRSRPSIEEALEILKQSLK